MGRALDIELKVIPAKVAVPFVDRIHYSHKHVNNSSLHLGAFLDGYLHGVMSFGPPLDKSHVIGLVRDTPWNGMLELNRMAFDDVLPRNSESHCIAMAMKMIRRQAPHIKWVLSFADACSCGDGTIYRASNFVLTGIKKNGTILVLPDGSKIADIAIRSCPNTPRPELGGKSLMQAAGKNSIAEYKRLTGAVPADGYMLRYIYFIDKRWRKRLTVPEIPFSEIRNRGISMYRGQKEQS